MIDAWTRPNLLPARAAIAAGLLCAMVTMVRADQPATNAGVQVVVAKATNACFSDKVRVTGFVVPRKEAVVIADGEGRVTDVLVHEGDIVTDNQDLVRLTGAGGSRTLKAPAAGLITEVRTIAGAPASPHAGPMLRIAVGNELEVEAEVPSIHALKVRPGATARISRDESAEFTGTVRLGAPQIDRKTQFGQVRIALAASPALKVGMFVRVTIDARRSCGVAIPRSAIDHSTVQVVKDNVVETRSVKVGLTSDSAIEIVDGVREGEIVVADAGTSLHDGDRIKPIFTTDSERSKAR
ncbi:efflux transporter periplasmic adaptor subunit [Rhodopseudomonas palustris]|uniref:Efflux transporter periplasmic adaptor subunit n=1 Tax=Rhodopseudomonas palustris TaxID=1076 RepID=A0A323UC97_RHOPL|nr:efflux RND transporter periplasmic adaptor subunit [Rhodopseudomonas palustris]PZA10502.1 efflux transporter periplasmic adaptor subunit [Rhodopseudomonas palustris]